MLTHISIRDFVLVDQLSLDFAAGMNVITGETGTGKSILVNALGLTLGERGSPSLIRRGCERADISASFDIESVPQAAQWLEERELLQGNECILRRTLAQNGASRAFINSTPVTLDSLKELSHILISIQGQHAHQTLLQRDCHLVLLDDFADLGEEAQAYRHNYEELLRARRELQNCYQSESLDERTLTLLEHELKELEELALSAEDYQQLEEEHGRLNNVDSLMETARNGLRLLDSEGEQPSILSQSGQLVNLLQQTQDKKLQELAQAALDADSILNDVQSQLRQFMDNLVADPQRFNELNERLAAIHNLTRKHRVQPQDLAALKEKRKRDLEERSGMDEKIKTLEKKAKELHSRCLDKAAALTAKRKKAARRFDKAVTEQLHRLQMPCRFTTQLTRRDAINMQGDSQVEFMLAASAETEPLPLRRIASGGELSRAALGIHIISARHSTVPCLVFDEVDSGIGGAVAEKVGRSLSALGKTAQVICITHQPQVAVYGDVHYAVNKEQEGKETLSTIKRLSESEKQQEIGRMIGGEKLTDEAMRYASTLMEEARHYVRS